VARRLGELLGQPVRTAHDCVGDEAEHAAAKLSPGDVLLLENLRFHPEEEANDAEFAGRLASLADIYVNDAFGAAHRAHASTEGVTHFLPAVAGLLMAREIDYLTRVTARPERPVGAVIGGAKVSDKMAILENLLARVDVIVIGGGMANTVLKSRGLEIGDSLVEDDRLETASRILADAAGSVRMLLPVDVIVADAFADGAQTRTVDVDQVPPDWRILDVGLRSVATYVDALAACKTVVWNGPLGVIEFPSFAKGSAALARALAEIDAVTIVGGGETAALVQSAGLADKFDHISTGGGAFLEFLEGRELPGVAALMDANVQSAG
jgi:phosphoglycerate kinase